MANLRNEFEFRSALLTALGQEHTEAEAKNEEMWRRKMLDGLGVEYDQNDVNQFGLFREKLIEGVTNYSGGGGESVETITVTMSFTSDPDGLGMIVAKTTGLELATITPTPQEFELVGSGSALISPYGIYNNVTGAEPYGDTDLLTVIDGATVVFS